LIDGLCVTFGESNDTIFIGTERISCWGKFGNLLKRQSSTYERGSGGFKWNHYRNHMGITGMTHNVELSGRGFIASD